MRRYLRSFFCSLFIFLALCAGNLSAHAASVEEIVYADVVGYLGQNEEARWIADAILYASSVYGVDPFLVTAMMEQESHFYIGSLSHAGAIGLMQLMPDTARIVGVDPYLPLDNILGGVAHIRDLLTTFSSWGAYGVTYAVAAYNAGAQAVFDYQGVPPYPETIDYVYGVAEKYHQLLGLYG